VPDRAADVAAIEAIIAEQQEAFNAKDAERFTAPWRERSWAVDVAGVELEGRDAILAAARTGFAGALAEQYARYEPGTVEFLGDDVAIIHAYARAVQRDGTPIDVGHSMIALYVLARGDDGWEIVARQNTLVQR
jgi:uncharacterized protein (TIGR02246 family)